MRVPAGRRDSCGTFLIGTVKRRIVSTLEGGYDLQALEACLVAYVGVFEECGL
jgi:acetoin utilization deacetylase AcuC-like enzyme